MAHNQINAIVSTSSGVFGGTAKAILGNILLSTITLQSLTEVAVYACVSAIVGYGVKLCIDWLIHPKNRKNDE